MPRPALVQPLNLDLAVKYRAPERQATHFDRSLKIIFTQTLQLPVQVESESQPSARAAP